MIIEARCDKCENRVFDIDTGNIDFPFHSSMFPQTVDCLHSRVWVFPFGVVDMELTCPECGGFPFEFRDGKPSGRIKIHDPEDGRFLKLVLWSEIVTKKAEIVERLSTNEFKPRKSKTKHAIHH